MLKSSISAWRKVSRGRIKGSLVIAKVLKFRAIFLNQCFQENISRRYLLFEIHLLKNKYVAPDILCSLLTTFKISGNII
jgi:hypothetical protein